MTASAAFYAKGAEAVCHPRNRAAASVLQIYRHCSCKEGSAGFVHAARCPKGELIKDLEGIWFVLVENPSHASIPPHQNGTMAKDAG